MGSLYEMIKRQQELKDKLMPPAVKSMLEMKGKFDRVYIPDIPQEISDLQERFKRMSFRESLQYQGLLGFTQPFSILNPSVDLNAFLYRDFVIPEPCKDDGEQPEKSTENSTAGNTKIKNLIIDIYNDNKLIEIVERRQFEEIVGELLRYHGYEVELTKQTRDGGYDLIALRILEGNIHIKALVECKRYKSKKIGIDIVRSFKEVILSEDANLGIIATTSYFTRDARIKQAETSYRLDFKDRNDIIQWVEEYQAKINR